MSESPDKPSPPPRFVDWPTHLSKIADSTELRDLIDRNFMQNPDSPHCLDWAGRTDRLGYPIIQVYGKLRPVVEVVYELFHHKRPAADVLVLRTWQRKLCVRKEHLYLAPPGLEKPRFIPPPDARDPAGTGGEGS